MDGIAEKDVELKDRTPETLKQLDKARQDGKGLEIRRACEQDNVDKLVELADSVGGLLDDTLRQFACQAVPRLKM